MLKFNTDGMIRQKFPFPKPIMDYILENLQPQHLVKLYPCCKLFYAKYGQPIIQHLEIVPDGKPESFGLVKTVVCASNPLLYQLGDFWISDSLIDRAQIGIYPTFALCTIKKLESNKYIFWGYFELLTNSGNIEDLKIIGVIGKEVNGFFGLVSVEEIIAKVPNATSIEICESHFTATTCTTLLSLDHKVKMSNLVLKNVTPYEFCQYNLFSDFVLKNSGDQCNVFIDFKMAPEVDDQSRYVNALLVKIGNLFREGIADGFKAKEMMKKVAAFKNEGFYESWKVMARLRTASFLCKPKCFISCLFILSLCLLIIIAFHFYSSFI